MAVTNPIIPLLISSWIDVRVVMYVCELGLASVYFTRPSRHWLHKLGVCSLVIADTVCVFTTNISVCFMVTGAADRNIYFFVTPIAIQIFTTYISAMVTQLFFGNLFYSLTENWLVSGVLVLLIVVHVGFSWASAVLILTNPLATTGISLTATAVGAISCAATDLIISLCLASKFWKIMQHTIPGHTTRSLVVRILTLTVGSGAICASVTLTMMILLLKNKSAFSILFVLQGRVYSLSILGSFIVGFPARLREETTPSQRFGSTISHSVHFHHPSSVAPERTQPSIKGGSNVSQTATASVPYAVQLSSSCAEESVHLEDLRRDGKARYEEE
ncbi:hypothetical protein C8R45DRAFT_1138672 [Mycena sanguinolenta]|nr:hypothetical protein C8R45DRAFT_1138672 [Mycena sanguinolenta]